MRWQAGIFGAVLMVALMGAAGSVAAAEWNPFETVDQARARQQSERFEWEQRNRNNPLAERPSPPLGETNYNRDIYGRDGGRSSGAGRGGLSDYPY